MYDLNEEQMSALKSICLGVHCEQRHMDIILGPSGSGKTRVIAYALLALAEDRRAVVFVPNSTQAIELLDAVEQLGDLNLGQQLGRVLVLSQENNKPRKSLLQHVDILAIVYSNVFLFWTHYIKETIKSFDSYKFLYDYHAKKNENLEFLDFLKTKISSAIKDLMTCFQIIQRLPKCLVDGIDDADITRLLQQLTHLQDDLLKKDITNEAMCSVFGIPFPSTSKISIDHDDGIVAAREMKEEMTLCVETIKSIKGSLKLRDFETQDDFKDYMLNRSQLLICPLSNSSLDTMLFNRMQKTGSKIDSVLVDDALNKSSRDFLCKIDLPAVPGVKNIVLAIDQISQEQQQGSILKVLSSMNTKRHELTQIYRVKEKNEALSDKKSQVTSTDY